MRVRVFEEVVNGSAAIGLLAGTGVWLSYEFMAGLATSMAAMVIIVATVAIYWQRTQWQLKLAVLPAFLTYLICPLYSIFINESVVFNDICQTLQALSIAVLVYFCWWNRRERPIEKELDSQGDVIEDLPINNQARENHIRERVNQCYCQK